MQRRPCGCRVSAWHWREDLNVYLRRVVRCAYHAEQEDRQC